VPPTETTGQAMRRSTRVTAEIAVRVRSLDPNFVFDEQCKTLLVNAQGCGFESPREIPTGIGVAFIIDGRHATATVLNATALGAAGSSWVIGAKLHQPGNFWGLPSPPADWAAVSAPVGASTDTNSAAELERQAGKVFDQLRSRVEQLLAKHEADFTDRLNRESAAVIRQAVESATKQEAERLRQAFAETREQICRNISEHGQRVCDAIERKIQASHAESAAAASEDMRKNSQEIVAGIREQANRFSEMAISQWNAAFEQTLGMLPELVKENLNRAQAVDPKPIHH